ncbi:phenylalanine--tRNA ligase subunit alpha [Candidatus Micrarchaeota archaeon]|nr:phenylalanine--tRNA ligase subunit alpha [Candidatus Micrarchaeota archaeon]
MAYYHGEKEIVEFLSKGGEAEISTLSEMLGMNEDMVRRAVESLKGKKFVEVRKKEKENLIFGREYMELKKLGELPEYSVFLKAVSGAGLNELTPFQRKVGLQWAIRKGMIRVDGGLLKAVMGKGEAERKNSDAFSYSEPDKIAEEDLDEFEKRGFLKKEKSEIISVSITAEGKDALSRGFKEEFNVEIKTADQPIGKRHPMCRAITKIRRIFTDMGFEEMRGNIVETAFWNFDSLFQPQDHPARELADTFYVEGNEELPEKKIVDKVKKEHEKGWKYKWDPEEAKKLILRTHTTALSARKLAELKKGPKKYFAVGRVYRNEATDFKHLAEFHQVEGIICWENATFRNLLGILEEFYKKLGFKKVRFRPSYFPYTEPSVEIEVFYEPRKEWMEMGGAGLFRPEVTRPLTEVYPVLAWGLSLERPLMIMHNIEDIRTFYRNDLNWLRGAKVGEDEL